MEGVVSSMAGKVMDKLFGVATREISNMWNCSKNVKSLESEAANLKEKMARLQQRMNLAKDEGQVLVEGLQEWMTKADARISEATDFIDEEAKANKTCCNVSFCVNLGTLYHYGKMAREKTYFLQQHQIKGEAFEPRVALPPPTPGFVDIYERKDFENIDSHKSTLKKIIQAIKDRQIVGIHGLGGVGKTTLAREAAAAMKDEFDYIEFITISRPIDIKRIEKDVGKAAARINNRDKVLIILDDVWEKFELFEIGIPCRSDNMRCKILLTSRIEVVCNAMNAHVILVKPLEDEEALILLKRVVGEREWDDKLEKVAWLIANECGGLPLFVQSVGNTLKKEDIKSWEAALNRLKDPTEEDVEFKRKGIMQLKLSYDYLESEVAKSCFLLCSMFPEDEIIGFNKLAYYGLGLRIFHNPNSNIQEAKDRVRVAVDSLKSSFLLLPKRINYDGEELFKMHDLVRDMAMLITSTGNNKFWVQSRVGLTEWQLEKHLESYQKISLMQNDIHKLPDHNLHFPHLDTFLIQGNHINSIVPTEFFRGMEKLRVLDMSRNNISSLPQSMKQLTELLVLDLSCNNSLSEISILGELTCLEILKLGSTGIRKIPEEIGQLTKLRLLDVLYCTDLSYVTPGVISKLIRLEELYLHLTKEGNCKILVELSELKSLTILHLTIPDLHYIPEDFHFETLIEFQISNQDYPYYIHGCKRVLEISDINFSDMMTFIKLIQLSEMLKLSGIKDLVNITDLYREGFDELRYIELEGCGNVTRLVKTSDLDAMQNLNELGLMTTEGKFFTKVEEIRLIDLARLELLWDSQHQYLSFSNLAKIYIFNCSLKKLFPLTVAQGLVNLRNLEIHFCDSLMVVISAGDEQSAGSEIEQTAGSETRQTAELVKQENDIVFPLLTHVCLQKLPQLESFCSGQSIIKYPSLNDIDVRKCPRMKRWSYGGNHMPKLDIDHHGINEYIGVLHEISPGSLRIWKDSGDDTRMELKKI